MGALLYLQVRESLPLVRTERENADVLESTLPPAGADAANANNTTDSLVAANIGTLDSDGEEILIRKGRCERCKQQKTRCVFALGKDQCVRCISRGFSGPCIVPTPFPVKLVKLSSSSGLPAIDQSGGKGDDPLFSSFKDADGVDSEKAASFKKNTTSRLKELEKLEETLPMRRVGYVPPEIILKGLVTPLEVDSLFQM